jgi:sugar O-acyltransferase (sialic acid O-acetyltransferase NeuD family)
VETEKVIIQGGGGHAKVVADCLLAQGKEVLAFVDSKYTGEQLGIPRQREYDLEANPQVFTLVAIGDNSARKKVSHQIRHKFINAIHPSATVSSFATVGTGCMILHRSVVQAGAAIGDHVIINTGSQVDHDCRVGDYVHIAPRAVLCGNVTVGEGTLVGAGAVIIPGIKVGAWAVIGAGTVVIKDVPDHSVVVGNPARILKQNQL